MLTLIAAALAASAPAAPAQASPTPHAHHQNGEHSDKDCCHEGCKDMAKEHEGHDMHGMGDQQPQPAQ